MLENFRIRVFRTVAQHLNFSRAAEELFLTQPAVTQQIRALEEELGLPLFDRGGGRVTLNASGKTLLIYAEKMKKLSDEAVTAVADASGQQAGEIVLGASQTIGQYLLPKFVAAFRFFYPKIRITASSGNSDEMLEALLSRKVHLALIEGPERRRDLHIEPFMEDNLVMVVPANHEWVDHEVTIADIKREPLIMREFGSGTRRFIERALARAGAKTKDLNISMELDSNEGLLSAVEAGLGVAFVSRWAARHFLSMGTLKTAKIQGLKLSRQFSLVYHAGPKPTGIVGTFRKFLLAQALEIAPKKTPRTHAHD